jgi:hypothetical protein
LLFSSIDAFQSILSIDTVKEGESELSSPVVEDEKIEEDTIQYHYDHLVPTRDVSIPEIEADRIWSMLDDMELNITGEGITIADLDTGVDWKHPDLWFADGASYEWIDDNTNGYIDSGDGIDISGDGDLQPGENLDIIDAQNDGTYHTELDWIWVESVSDDGIPQIGERFFVANDTNDNNVLDLGEELIMLNTPKTKYIVEGDGTDPMDNITWERGVNLTSSTHTDIYGHGTAVSGILCGGHPEYRKYTGVAPSAELIMVKVFDGGASNTGIPLYDAIVKAVELGADVILIEAGQWVEVFMDGSSDVEQLIDSVSASGIPVISPSGNLGGSDKHAMFDVVENTPHAVDFHVSNTGTESVWMSALTVDPTNMSEATFIISIPTGGIPTHNDVVLNPGVGYRNYGTDSDPGTGVSFDSYIDTSSRGTEMLYFEMYKSGGVPLDTPYKLTIETEDNCTFHAYVQDSMSGWSGGTVFQSDTSNNYIITFPATADSAISVASYHTRSYYGTIGDIAGYSARGPRIDGVLQQGVAAPGGYVNGSGLAGVYFNYTTDSWASHVTVEMTDSGSYYSGTIPGQVYGATVSCRNCRKGPTSVYITTTLVKDLEAPRTPSQRTESKEECLGTPARDDTGFLHRGWSHEKHV